MRKIINPIIGCLNPRTSSSPCAVIQDQHYNKWNDKTIRDFPSHFFFNIDVLSSGANLIILVQFNEVLLFDSCFDEGQNYRQTAIRSVTNFYFSVIQWRWRGVEVTRPIIGILIFCFDGAKTQENCFEGPK